MVKKILSVLMIALVSVFFSVPFSIYADEVEKSFWSRRNEWKYLSGGREVVLDDSHMNLITGNGNFYQWTDTDINTAVLGSKVEISYRFASPVQINSFMSEIFNSVQGLMIYVDGQYIKTVQGVNFAAEKVYHPLDGIHGSTINFVFTSVSSSSYLIFRKMDIKYVSYIVPTPSPTPTPPVIPTVDPDKFGAEQYKPDELPTLDGQITSVFETSSNHLQNLNTSSDVNVSFASSVSVDSSFPDIKVVQNSVSYVNDIEFDFSHATAAGGRDSFHLETDGHYTSTNSTGKLNFGFELDGQINQSDFFKVRFPDKWGCVKWQPGNENKPPVCAIFEPVFSDNHALEDFVGHTPISFVPSGSLKALYGKANDILNSPDLPDNVLQAMKIIQGGYLSSQLGALAKGFMAENSHSFTPRTSHNGYIESVNKDIQFDGVRYSYTRDTVFRFDLIVPDNQFVDAVLKIPADFVVSDVSTSVGQAFITGNNEITLRNTNNFVIKVHENILNSDVVSVRSVKKLNFDIVSLSFSKGTPSYDRELWTLLNKGTGDTPNVIEQNEKVGEDFNDIANKETEISNGIQNDFNNAVNEVDTSNHFNDSPDFLAATVWVKRQFDRMVTGNAFGILLGFSLVFGFAMAILGKFKN